ncbi:MAG: hypothetical protein ABIT09_07105 [Croceibacterium sp.]
MEYEIEDQCALFDASTNPSLQAPASPGAPGRRAKAKREFNSDDRKRQRGEAIPEEDADTQMG